MADLDLDPSHHIFRYVGGGSIDGDFIDPAAFRRKVKDGKLEEGLSVNWVEYFQKVLDEQHDDPSHSLIKDYDEAFNVKLA